MFDTRNAQIQWATWLLDNKAKGIDYTEGPARMSAIGIWPPKFPLTFDCSAFCTYVALLANGGPLLAMDGGGNAYVGFRKTGASGVDKYAASSLTQTNIFNNHATGTTLPYPQYFLCYDTPATAQQQIVMII